MQCSASRPTSSASTAVRPLSSSTRWNSCGPSPGVTPVHSEVYGFIRSPVEERGSSCRNTSRSRQVGTSFSMPMTVISVCGRVRHIRPLPSDSTTASVPVSATAKFAPLIATRARRNRSRRCARAAMASRRGSSVSAGSTPGIVAQEDLADLGPVLVDRRHEDVATACRRRAGRSARRGRSRARRCRRPRAPR